MFATTVVVAPTNGAEDSTGGARPPGLAGMRAAASKPCDSQGGSAIGEAPVCHDPAPCYPHAPMNASLNWICSYLDRPVELEQAAQALTAMGFPTEQWEAVETRDGRDWRMDVEVTSNRPDCLCHLGLARELAAGLNLGFTSPAIADEPAGTHAAPEAASVTRVDNEATDLCPLYTARVIRGVKVGPSPDWLVSRLEAAGLRSVNNVVDVTNFVLLETGQPLHAFDMARLDEGRIVVRRAKRGEPITAIDGSRHTLDEPMLVIADAARPVAIAGVMGGQETEVGDETTDVLLESAAFDPLSVRRTSRALKLSSDSSYRFERGVDVAGVDRASRRAAALIIELAGGSPAAGVIRAGCEDPIPRSLVLRPARCRQLMGIDFTVEQLVDALGRLGLDPAREGDGVDEDDRIVCRIPTHRLDLQREVDLIEEVARLHGLDRVPVREKIEIIARPPQASVQARRRLGQVLSAHGYFETITLSFVPMTQGEPFVPAGHEAVVLDDERRKAEPMLRPSLLPSLLACRKGNQDAGNEDLRLYEAASVWARREGTIHEWHKLGMLCDAPDRQRALREVRGTIEEAIATLTNWPAAACEPIELHSFSAAAEVRSGDRVLGRFGLLDPAVQKRFDLQTPVVLAELDLPPIIEAYPPEPVVQPLARYPGIERDLSVIVDEPVAWASIERTVRETDPPLLAAIDFLTTYRGKPIEKGRKSVSFRMTFRDPGRTLRHEEVDPQVEAVVDALRENVGAELRAS